MLAACVAAAPLDVEAVVVVDVCVLSRAGKIE